MADKGKAKKRRRAGGYESDRTENPDPSLWTVRSSTSGRFSRTKQNGGPYEGGRPIH